MKKYLIFGVLLLLAGSLPGQYDLALDHSIKHRRGSLGVGYGLCYAGLGFNGEYNFSDDIAVSGSIGTFGYVSGYELGLKYFFSEFDNTFRPMVSLWYGVNAMTIARPSATSSLKNITEAHTGFTAGAGMQMMFKNSKRHGLDASLLYIINNDQAARLKELESQGYGEFSRGSRVLLSFGYRYAF